jgi:hypothetical protein
VIFSLTAGAVLLVLVPLIDRLMSARAAYSRSPSESPG